jgi:hypothetical protein
VIDAMAEKAFSSSPYYYCKNNPIIYVDPDGNWSVEIKQRPVTRKKKDGTEEIIQENYLAFIAEKDDNLQTLAEQTGLDAEQLKNDLGSIEITAGTKLSELGKQGKKILNGMNKALNYPAKKLRDSNCFGTAITLSRYGEVSFSLRPPESENYDGVIGNPEVADNILSKEFAQQENPRFGDVIRFANDKGWKGTEFENDNGFANNGNDVGGAAHFAIFLLKNKSGETFTFGKNGFEKDKSPWTVMTANEIETTTSYGKPMAIGTTGNPYYRIK